MIIQLKPQVTPQQVDRLRDILDQKKFTTKDVNTQKGSYLIAIGKGDFDIRSIGFMEGVADIHVVSDNYKLVSAKWKVDPSEVDLGDGVNIKQGGLALMAGPCSIEGEEQINNTVEHLKEAGIRIMRGGVYKPRSSPYSFRGMGIEGLKLWHEIAQRNGIKIISEVMQVSQIEEMHDYVDIFQVGARNTQNYNLLDELGKVDKPVLIKRGISGTIDELLYSAEYVFSGGNENLLLCERGIRTYEKASRNTFDINAIPILKAKSHLPVISDPSHGIGIRDHVPAIAMASVLAGADGVIYETHQDPRKAFSDGQQTLNFRQSSQLANNLRRVMKMRKEML
ncbi:MAG: 3-deoxy-7-phosphoheptulonate synthase [Cyclobacteriaceae bacterium]|nr:MAG: 3-deoxy-7-phosphoheptulonate synthase [Cyclobacteriaceae bacterium]